MKNTFRAQLKEEGGSSEVYWNSNEAN